MCNINNRNTSLLLYSADQLYNLRLNGYIQRSCRLITDQQGRVTGECNRNDNSLSHTAGQLMRIILHSLLCIFNTYLFEKLHGFCPGFFLRSLEMPDHTFHDLFTNRHSRIKTCHRVLKYHGNSLAIDMSAYPFLIFAENIYRLRCSISMMIGEFNTAVCYCCIGCKNTHGSLHRNRFTGTGFSYDGNRFSFLQVYINTSYCMDWSSSSTKGDIQIFDLKNCVLIF